MAGMDAENVHPALKPLKLCKYLATLLTPPAIYAPRRLLVPFSGAGSECIGAMLAGWEQVIGIEQSPDYVDIARTRARFWAGNYGLFEDVTDSAPDAQSSMEFA